PQNKSFQQGSDSAAPQTLIGCIDVLIGYPSQETAMLGLLIISELHQSKGYGREALALLEDQLHQYPQIQKIRIGVVETNSEVLSFWKKQGVAEIGERKPYVNGDVRSEVLVLEKFLRRN
ncbi:MAG: GNAT family N-acetyltransferase, partial [Proteobacteria bacterium]